MPTSFAAPIFAAEISGRTGAATVAGVAAVVIIAVLAWQLWRTQRHYAHAMDEQARLLGEERERVNQALQEREVLARDSQGKSEMLATLSREIRANLNGIIGSADLMLDNAPTSQDREHLTTLRTSAESLHQSLNDVLDYSRIETGQIQIAQTPFDLRQPLIDVVEHLSPLAILKELELVLIVAPDVPVHVVGDPVRLRQILFNLMSNSVRFTTSGRVVLRVELGTGSGSKPGGQWMHFTVSDTGPRIPEESQATLFDRFAQSDRLSPRKVGGSGLELAVSKRLAELMGGRIGARNLPESGAEFWVVLPLPLDRASTPAPLQRVPGLHVVVLGDLAASRVAVSALLTRLGIDHDATDTPAKAVELLHDALDEEARELVLLLDESVAKRSEGELARLLAGDARLQSARVVLVARDPDGAVKSAHDLPVSAVVRKPLLRADVLIEAVRKPLGGAATRVSGSRAPFERAGEPRTPARRGPCVLVVDDDEISRSVSSQLLARMGCVVEVAESGPQAIDRTRVAHYDLIFMDCQMPEMDGFAATREIRALTGESAPPIVALTANTTPKDRERCSAAGMCDFIDKPVRKAELLRVLKRWIHDRQAAKT